MPEHHEVAEWKDKIRRRYENYLTTLFYFKNSHLRASFRAALETGDGLLKGPFVQQDRGFVHGRAAREIADEAFAGNAAGLHAALLDKALYEHQERALRRAHIDERNVVVATGTASGKTESFLYPILFSLYQEHLDGTLDYPGVRAMILYPMNALANDQRDRLGAVRGKLGDARSDFKFTFGQYIGQTPYNSRDTSRNASAVADGRLPGELIYREEMWDNPPHILMTNYSMLEYLLLRPSDSPLFDGDRGRHWKFFVLDEAHQYRGTKGMEMGMLLRRLKQRVRAGGRTADFRCIATSATMTSGRATGDREAVAGFAEALFGEDFSADDVVFESTESYAADKPRRYHLFCRALEGAFLVHADGEDRVVLNRLAQDPNSAGAVPLEIALCRECGEHYYVGRQEGGQLREADRDPSRPDFGVEYYLPSDNGDHDLCRGCGKIWAAGGHTPCDCAATITVRQCPTRKEQPDQLVKCGSCEYRRGGIGDPVREVVHGSDGPNAVIATALLELLPEDDSRKVLAFADSRQEAAFFAWYLQDTYSKIRNRSLIYKAVASTTDGAEELSVDDLADDLWRQLDKRRMFRQSDTAKTKQKKVLQLIMAEAITSERRLSLEGVGLVRWFTALPEDIEVPKALLASPWNLSHKEARPLVQRIADEFRLRRAVELPEGAPPWPDVSPWPQVAICRGPPNKQKRVVQWGGPQTRVVRHFLTRVLAAGHGDLAKDSKSVSDTAVGLMNDIWNTLMMRDRGVASSDRFLERISKAGAFRVRSQWLRVALVREGELLECDTCGTVSTVNIRGVCARNGCSGWLKPADHQRLGENHYRVLYENQNSGMPSHLRAEEHTAQIDSDEARRRQERFLKGEIQLLSSSTTFEVGVDLGDLETVFLRNVPPETFNYTQRVGRAGRRSKPGLALTYCRSNPHDLYHYEDPERRLIEGEVRPPRLTISNDKIIRRHMTAVALAAFFRASEQRFENVEALAGDWEAPDGTTAFRDFVSRNGSSLVATLQEIVPPHMHMALGLLDDNWIEQVAGPDSRLARVEGVVCNDYCAMESVVQRLIEERSHNWNKLAGRVEGRQKAMGRESVLSFLSRRAVIPKYGFPVDVVELDTRSNKGVSLSRDLSQAIAEYAPGSRVVANKLEWQCTGIKVVEGLSLPVRSYRYDKARNFRQWDDTTLGKGIKRYVSPVFGFSTPLFEEPREPKGRTRRLYTTRPFFRGVAPAHAAGTIAGVRITRAQPGELVVLCEGRKKKGFYICLTCGSGFVERKVPHKSSDGRKCGGMLEQLSLGHELVTDVLRLQFPGLRDEWDAYSVAYAVLLGAAKTLDVPDTDLNVTITAGEQSGETGIVLYDNVPGGAGLVAQLEREAVFRETLERARDRVGGGCGCGISCYGCLRSYRNQFAHPHLNRTVAAGYLGE